MTTQLDLRPLAVDRRGTTHPPRRRRIVSRYVLPAAVVLGFAGMLAWAVRDSLLPAQPVTIVPVVVTRAEVQQAGTPLFQAAGWVEPRPTPVLVSALAEGVVEELLVVAGQDVQKGEPVARLIDTDARLALKQAEADLALRQAERASAQADFDAARLRLDHPVHLDAALAEAQALLARAETDFAQLPFLIQAAQARADFARRELERRQAASGVVTGSDIQQAASDQETALAALKELQQRGPRLERQIAALRRQAAALQTQRELLIDEQRQLAAAEAQIQAAQARETQARLAVEAARLALDRMTVRAPRAGRVLELMTRPGARLTGRSSQAAEDSGNVVSLYDPTLLQIRADVRLEDVPLVTPGQPVEIETASAPQPLHGEVLHATSSASVQKNTLEVKVALHAPPDTIRPEMLVSATFLAPERPRGEAAESQRERLLIPRQLVDGEGDDASVWLAESGGIARKRSIRLGRAGTAELIDVVAGLSPTDKLIAAGRETLTDGQRITITGEDPSLGQY